METTLLPSTIGQLAAGIRNTRVTRDAIRFQYFRPVEGAGDGQRFYDDVIRFYDHAYFHAPLQRFARRIFFKEVLIHDFDSWFTKGFARQSPNPFYEYVRINSYSPLRVMR